MMIVGTIVPGSLVALEAQARIDDDIAELHQAIQEDISKQHSLHSQINALRTQRNQLSLVSRFPSEILSAIFIHSASMWHEFPTDRVPRWVNVSYVCRYWRDIALNCPNLWTYISTTSQRWTEELLSRSKQSPLKIHFGWEYHHPSYLRLLEQVLDHTERIQELNLDFPSGDYKKVSPMLSSSLSSPAPLLRSLAVSVRRNEAGLTPAVWSAFDSAVPALRRLELNGCLMPRLTSTPGSLTTLILHRTFQATIAQVMTTLYSMQNLVHLELLYAVSSRSELDTHSTNDVDHSRLPHLLRLAIDDENPSNIIELLPLLNISSQTEVRIRTNRSIMDDDDEWWMSYERWMSFRSLLVNRFFTSRAGYNPPCIHTLVIDASSNCTTTFVFSGSAFNAFENTDRCPQSLDWGYNVPLQITFSRDDEMSTIREIVQDAHSSRFLAGLQGARVIVGIKWLDGLDDWSVMLENALGFVPELRYI